MKWTLSARGFGTEGKFIELQTVEAATQAEAKALLREGPHHHVFCFAARDVRLEPEDRRVLLVAYWHPRQAGGHRARGRWTRHQKFPGDCFALCGHVASPYTGSQMAHQCGDGDWLQGDKARCRRCEQKAAAMAPSTTTQEAP